mgnify:CR=1 FL=1
MTPGEALERAVMAGNEWYLAQNIVLVTKVPTPIKVLGKVRKTAQGREFTACFERRATCDFLGIFLQSPGGHYGPRVKDSLALECKSTTAARLPYSAVQPQQRQWLDAAQWSYLLIEFLGTGTETGKSACRLVPWSALHSSRSMGPEDGFVVDAVRWLDPVLRAANP